MKYGMITCAAIALALAGFVNCTSIRRGLIGMFSPENKKDPPAAGVSNQEPTTSQEMSLVLQKVLDGFEGITDMQFLPGSREQLVVLEKSGAAHLVNLKTKKRSVFFKVKVDTASELGLLGLAFSPQFETNRHFFVHYNPHSKLSRVSLWSWVGEVDRPSIQSPLTKELRVILDVEQPYQNHNGGSLVFGPDDMLYVGFGDGGWRGDPENRSQNLETLLGKMLRFDVRKSGERSAPSYQIPVDNPYVGRPGVKAEIFAYGLRNPWKYSFDDRGRLLAADVGQDKWEEVSFVPPGANLGWRIFEGVECYGKELLCQQWQDKVVRPFVVYDHSLGASITGGFQYKGQRLGFLRDRYVFGDFTTGRIWSVPLPERQPDQPRTGSALTLHGKWDLLISTFARDHDGELYVADFSSGAIFSLASDAAGLK
jgi:glucose/arabinose dehydrogenase